MIRKIAPQFFTTDIPATLAYYKDKLGFDECDQLRQGLRVRGSRRDPHAGVTSNLTDTT